ncbi:hypothetical protein FRB90_007050, partial [Tulasnella sp. 427]
MLGRLWRVRGQVVRGGSREKTNRLRTYPNTQASRCPTDLDLRALRTGTTNLILNAQLKAIGSTGPGSRGAGNTSREALLERWDGHSPCEAMNYKP